MKDCIWCGRVFSDDLNFCSYCGRVLSASRSSSGDGFGLRLDEWDRRFRYANRIVVADYDCVLNVKKDGSVCYYGRTDACAASDFVKNSERVVMVSGKLGNIAVLREDGTVRAFSDSGDPGFAAVNGWQDIVSVAVGMVSVAGLKRDGTVVACGENSVGQCNVGGWNGIVSIGCSLFRTVGVKKDGSVVATPGRDYEQIGAWRDIVSVACGGMHTAGLKRDGTVVWDAAEQCRLSVKDWYGIVAIACDEFDHIMGLREDGTVVVSGKNEYWGPEDVKDWRGIIAISCSYELAVGLKSDGTFVTTDAKKDLAV